MFYADGQADMTKLAVAFGDFANAPRKRQICPSANCEDTWGGGVDVQLRSFVHSAIDGDEGSGSRPGRFTPRVKSLRYELNWRLGGRSEEKNFLPLRGIEGQYPVSELVVRSLYRLSYPVEPQKRLPHDPRTNSLNN